MMMQRWLIAFTMASLFLSGQALGEIYYWVDDQGTQHYTTRLESIPEPYRSKAIPLALPTSPPVPPELTPNHPPKSPTKISFAPGSPVLVSARINGVGPIILMLDTGADRTLVSPSALMKLGISIENVRRGVLKGVTGMSYAEAIWVNSVEVGDAKVGPLFIIVHEANLKEADGLLGRDFLANFNVRIDSRVGVVTLEPD